MFAKIACLALGAGGAVGFQPRRTGMSMMAGRTPIIAGNWKMNPTSVQGAEELGAAVAKTASQADGVEVVMFPPHCFLPTVLDVVGSSPAKIGSQNVYVEEKGAFTGAISPLMLESLKCEYVLCGHSERRVVFHEDEGYIAAKIRTVLDHNMKAILCIGESRMEYEKHLNKQVCAIQLAKDLDGVTADEMANVVIAYEPVWAIGTGLTATKEIAQEVHAFVRSWLRETYGDKVADETRIQYGGSVTPETVDDLMSQPDIDGCLVGGASLIPESFDRICNYQKEAVAA